MCKRARGLISYIWFKPNEIGRYDILCEELCGIGHFVMSGAVVIDTQGEFVSWLAEQRTFAETQDPASPNVAAGQAQFALCATCHGAQGEGD